MMDFPSDNDHQTYSWEKVTKKHVDPITFSCTFDVAFVPRIEDCSYETTCFAMSHPRFGERTTNGKTKPTSIKRKSGTTPIPANLGEFFRLKATVQGKREKDNQSVASTISRSSRSIADRSRSERSKAEEKLRNKAKERRGGEDGESTSSRQQRRRQRVNSKDSLAKQSIDEMSTATFGTNDGSVDHRSVMSGSTLGSKSISILSNADRSNDEQRQRNKSKIGDQSDSNLSAFLEDQSQSSFQKESEENSITLEEVGMVEKKLRFKDEHDIVEIPRLTDSMYDDLFFTNEELADFRYEAFLEENGLDVDEYMNMENVT